MLDHLLTAVFLSLPLVVGGVLHMIAVKTNFLKPLNVPISLPMFGSNKTYRGFVVMPAATVLGVAIAQRLEAHWPSLLTTFAFSSTWELGAALGLAYVIFELPNSFIKRRLGIAPGKLPAKNKFWFGLIDQTDSALGCILVYALMIYAPTHSLVMTLLLGPLIHLLVNLGLYSLKLRKEPF